MASTLEAVDLPQPPTQPTASVAPDRVEITYLFGIRGVSSLYVLFFHLNYIVLAAHQGSVDPLYSRLTDWIRVGDFRVSAFFVISGYLLTLPTLRTRDWKLRGGIKAFLARRVERLLFPYYVALAISVVLYVAWRLLIHQPPKLFSLVAGTIAHVLMLHNLYPKTNLYINDTLWNVALEFQCYLLFVFVLLPVMRRWGPWAQLGVAAAIGLGPHFLMHGFLDWTRPWFITLYGMGVAVSALANRTHPELTKVEQRVPWGTLWLAMSIASIVAIVASGKDTTYGAGWLQNILLGIAVSSLLVYTRLGFRGNISALAKPVVHFLETPFLCKIGRFSYSTYLIHYPILRLAVALTALWTSSILVLGGIAFFVYAPLTVLIAYGFHVRFERPFQKKRFLVRELET